MFTDVKEVVGMHLSTGGIRALRAGLPVVAALAVTISLAACGSSSSGSGVASVGSGNPTTGTTPAAASSAPTANSSQLIRYAQCMRANGVPNFPDPTGGRLLLRGGPGTGLNPNSPAFRAAAQKCKSLQPSGTAGNSSTDRK